MPSDERLNLLLDTLAQVAISVELQPTLQILLDSLHTLVPFDAGGIFVQQTERQVVRARATRGYPGDLEMPASEGIVGEVIRSGRSRLVRDVRRDPRYVAVRPSTAAQLSVPLASPRGVLGAIALESDRVSAFDDQDLSLVTLFAQQATVVIERAVLYEQLTQQSRLRRDIEIAGEILRGLTPAAAPALLGVQIVGRSLTAESVGGDAYDFIPYPEHQVGLSIADAKGKGLPAALLAVAHRAMLHALVSMELRLRATFGRMSDMLARSLPAGNFVTAFYGIVDITERRMVYANAGHLPPLVVRKNGTVELLEVTGAALGFPHVAPMREAYAVFGPGDGLVLFTDGVTEAGPSPEEFFDVSGVEATVRTLWTGDAEAVVTGLLDEVVRRGGGVLSDDATVVVMKFD
ncbi:MAG TPA: GAF domain-containing SpoIIE family protein phosphatase [Gemmatimonadaceae bacterium]|nr:GAF domain-containing SpoIIE family protein phosphatase [Gemmatimonadaceae bacterium]